MKKVALLPSLFTTGNLFCGVYAIILALNGRDTASAWFIIVAIIFDFLDGQIARFKNVVSQFGFEYDSLADLISFGIAPALLLYLFVLKGLGRIGSVLVFAYIACAALRLARFNTQKVTQHKPDFAGLPAPAAGGFLATIFILNYKYPCPLLIKFTPVIMFILAMLMVSAWRYPAMGTFNLWKKKPFLNLVTVILCGTVAFLQLELFLFFCGLGYILFGILGRKWMAIPSIKKSMVKRSEHEVV